jgi:hypothetical protein
MRGEDESDAGWGGVGAAAARRQRDGEGAGAGIPVAEDVGHRRARDYRGSGARQERQRDLRQPSVAADAGRAGDGGGDPRRAAAGGAAAERSFERLLIGVVGADTFARPRVGDPC